MAWMKIETSVARHRKFIKAGPGPSWLWVCAMAYAKESMTNGFIPDEAVGYLGLKERIARRMIERLVSAELLVPVDGGWVINDFLDGNKSAEDIRALSEKRKAAGKQGGVRSGEERRERNEAVIIERREQDAKQIASTTAEATVEPRVERKKETEKREAFASHTPSHTPIISRRRLDAAWEGPRGLYVPQKQHRQFVALRGGNEATVFAFYDAVGEEWGHGARARDEPGSDMFKFWNARYEERWPATAAKPRTVDQGPAYRKVVMERPA